jgi:hypothetical protein
LYPLGQTGFVPVTTLIAVPLAQKILLVATVLLAAFLVEAGVGVAADAKIVEALNKRESESSEVVIALCFKLLCLSVN